MGSHFYLKCGAYLRAALKTIVILLSTVFTQINAVALIKFPQMRRLFEDGTYSSNYCNWQLKSLLHLEQIVITFRTLLHLGQNDITFRTLLHLGSFITFRPSTDDLSLSNLERFIYHSMIIFFLSNFLFSASALPLLSW